jgi:hypothetical protein
MRKEPFSKHDQCKLLAHLHNISSWRGKRGGTNVELNLNRTLFGSEFTFRYQLGPRQWTAKQSTGTLGEALEKLNFLLTGGDALRRRNEMRIAEKNEGEPGRLRL